MATHDVFPLLWKAVREKLILSTPNWFILNINRLVILFLFIKVRAASTVFQSQNPRQQPDVYSSVSMFLWIFIVCKLGIQLQAIADLLKCDDVFISIFCTLLFFNDEIVDAIWQIEFYCDKYMDAWIYVVYLNMIQISFIQYLYNTQLGYPRVKLSAEKGTNIVVSKSIPIPSCKWGQYADVKS